MCRGRKLLRRALQHEFSRRQVVVRPRVDPEELRISPDLRQRLFVAGRVRDDGFEHVPHVQVVDVPLIEKNVASGDRRLVEVPNQNALLERQRIESLGVQLHDRRFVNSLEEVLALSRPDGWVYIRRNPGWRRHGIWARY
jgi:hypothetical protein